MSIEVKVPQLPESVADATLVSWHKKPGEAVSRDENLVDIETDKVVLEVPAPADGVLKEIKIEDGTTVGSGEVIALLEEGAVADKQEKAEGPATPEKPAASDESASDEGRGEAARKLSPSVRRLV
ncbi:MAG: dihydrolipoamide succinyltransferase, partial [Gammaproteobacteria bacterium]